MVDMDGVLCDFVAQWFAMTKTNMLPRDFENLFGKEAFDEELARHGELFWSSMPLMEDAMLLWNYIRKYTPLILTKPTSEEHCRTGKEIWVRKHFPRNIEIVFSRNKEEWADENSLLIDDTHSNITKFIIAGGEGIEHTSALETIKILKEKYGM